MSQTRARHRLDDLRHFATTLGAAAGLASGRAAALASHLLWYDAAGRPRGGIATLPDWLKRLERREIDPEAEVAIGAERAATARLDGRGGVGPLVLSRGAEVASEKAREVGVGLVRVGGLGPTGPAAAVVAEAALGPFLAVALGPGPSWSLAIPTAEGLPVVADSAFVDPAAGAPLPPLPWPGTAVVPEGEWLIQVVAVAAFEPLEAFRERVSSGLVGSSGGPAPGLLRPDDWEAHRRAARERGIALEARTWKELRRWADRLEVPAPGR